MYKNELNFPWWILIIVIIGFSSVCYFWFSLSKLEEPIDKLKREAVAAGHAEFVVDKEGNVTFKWKEICK